MENNTRLHVPRSARSITLLLVLITCLMRFLIASLMHRGTWVVSAECVALIFVGIAYTFNKVWSKQWLIGLSLFNLVYFSLRGFILGELVLAGYEIVVSLLTIFSVAGKPKTLRAASCLGGYGCMMIGLVTLMGVLASHHRPLDELIATAQVIPVYKSSYLYEVSFQQLPWKLMTADQTDRVLGSRVEEADLRLIREDGGSFALFFPLQFHNIRFTPELGVELEAEIEDRWLTDLHNWKRTSYEDGFLLTANGQVEQTPLTYAIFYKHFGNFGLYAVFWTEQQHADQIVHEAQTFYEQIHAAPLKERLPVFTAAQIYQLNSPAVVLINVYDHEGKLIGRGSGFNVASTGLIVTNYHLLDHGKTLEVIFPHDGTYKEVSVLAVSKAEADLALLALKGAALPTVKGVQTVSATPGDAVYVIGNPKGLVNSVSEGIIGGLRKDGGMLYYQITAPISRGSSGGPVFNEYGEVIGVASALVEGGQNLNFSIAIEELRHLIVFPRAIPLEEFHSLLEENNPSD